MSKADSFVGGSKQAGDILGSRMVDKRLIETEKNRACLGSTADWFITNSRNPRGRACSLGVRKGSPRSRAVCSSQASDGESDVWLV